MAGPDFLGDVPTLGAQAARLHPGAGLGPDGRYVLEEVAGRGGIGVVWRARDRELGGGPVALKFLPEVLATDEIALQDLRREARTMLALTHPGIVRLYNLERDEGLVFLVMEYLEGPNLRGLLARRRGQGGKRGLTPGEVLWVLKQVAPALDYAHVQGALHRDLKPANLLLTKDSEGRLGDSGEGIRLADFGIAYMANLSYTMATGRRGAGTPAYMAPEVLQGEDPIRASDLYGLGATLFELVRGRPPYPHGDPRPLDSGLAPPGVESGHAGLDTAIRRVLAADLKARPESAAEVLALARGETETRESGAGRSVGPTEAVRAPEVWEVLEGEPSYQGWAHKVRDPRTGIAFLLVEPGTFPMGSPDLEEDRDDDEGPVHKVEITKPFYLGETEVTQAQWQQVMGSNPSDWKGDDFPVDQVSWNDAMEFCRKAGYRLPTEAEWEYACRAGSTTRFSFGDCDGDLPAYAWYDDNSVGQTHPVGQKKPNAWDLFDMHGNVWEWCADWYAKDYYVQSPRQDPQGPSSGSTRVVRGGSWYNLRMGCRSAYRYGSVPTGRGNYGGGFRVARTP